MWPFVSGFLHLACFQGPSMESHVPTFLSFSDLNSPSNLIPQNLHVTYKCVWGWPEEGEEAEFDYGWALCSNMVNRTGPRQ